ncbi:glycine cleavage system protein H [Streptomyces sp. 900105245]
MPVGFQYARNHTWHIVDFDGLLLIGVTDYGQRALGDVTSVELCATSVRVSEGEVVAKIASASAVSEVGAPFSGEIVAANMLIWRNPGRINSAPYVSWLVKMWPTSKNIDLRWMSSAEYAQFIT